MRVYDTREYKTARRLTLRENPVCVRCNRAPSVCAHHILPIHAGGPIADRSNLMALCRPCHIEIENEIRWRF